MSDIICPTCGLDGDAQWRISAHEDGARSWITLIGPKGQSAAFSAERGTIGAQVLQDFMIERIAHVGDDQHG